MHSFQHKLFTGTVFFHAFDQTIGKQQIFYHILPCSFTMPSSQSIRNQFGVINKLLEAPNSQKIGHCGLWDRLTTPN